MQISRSLGNARQGSNNPLTWVTETGTEGCGDGWRRLVAEICSRGAQTTGVSRNDAMPEKNAGRSDFFTGGEGGAVATVCEVA
eukprot:CAMPEP_0177793814 /NCGR_PEP_ID=MMETSP0491_2-20121128/25287_1 /TAXON_ID=63592 /ORGANISM="Tetraselmis chuii, Strain PLY429" /LENGTH=82 /DNA_ID=CAMNT_0019316377 /DNA_START=210 /DNA_END=455 /DNA_ORIENTATION=-